MLPGFFTARDRVRERDVPRSGTDGIDKNSPQFKALREQALKLGLKRSSPQAMPPVDRHFLQWLLHSAGHSGCASRRAEHGNGCGMDLGETADIGSNILTQFGFLLTRWTGSVTHSPQRLPVPH